MAAVLSVYGIIVKPTITEQTVIVEHLITDTNASIKAVADQKIAQVQTARGKSSTFVSASYSHTTTTVAGVSKRLSTFKYTRPT